jgi:hypothetical protein
LHPTLTACTHGIYTHGTPVLRSSVHTQPTAVRSRRLGSWARRGSLRRSDTAAHGDGAHCRWTRCRCGARYRPPPERAGVGVWRRRSREFEWGAGMGNGGGWRLRGRVSGCSGGVVRARPSPPSSRSPPSPRASRRPSRCSRCGAHLRAEGQTTSGERVWLGTSGVGRVDVCGACI